MLEYGCRGPEVPGFAYCFIVAGDMATRVTTSRVEDGINCSRVPGDVPPLGGFAEVVADERGTCLRLCNGRITCQYENTQQP